MKTVKTVVDEIKAEMEKQHLNPTDVEIEDEDPNYVGVIIYTDDHFYDDDDNIYEHEAEDACRKVEAIINNVDKNDVVDEYEGSKIDYKLWNKVSYEYDSYEFVLKAENWHK